MNNQEAFNTVLHALRKQGVPSASADTGNCLYRHKGRKCAAGHLIPDDLYDRSMEGKTIQSVLNAFWSVSAHLAGVDIGLLQQMQWVHDDAARTRRPLDDQWEQAMSHIASYYGLVYTPPETVAA